MAKRAKKEDVGTTLTADEASALAVDVMVFLRERGVAAGDAWQAVAEAFAAAPAAARVAPVDLLSLWYEAVYGQAPVRAPARAA